MLEITLAIILGVLSGIVTGLIPGIHINLITTSIISTPLAQIKEIPLITYIVALSVTHTFIDFIPSIYLGAASEETINSILPGHKYLLKGQAYKAVRLTLIGSTIAIVSLIVIIPSIYIIISTSYNFINKMMGFFLIVIIIILLSSDKKSISQSIIVFSLAGILGTITINSNINQPLLPLLTGLFGASTIINSIEIKTKIPLQKIEKPNLNKKDLIKPTLLTMLVSPLCSFMPGLGASQAATLSQKISKEQKEDQYLILLGSINTLVMTTSFFTLYLINKTRTGAASAIAQLTNLTPQILILIIITIIISAILSYPITLIIAKIASKKINKINYKKISYIILTLLTILIFSISGFHGLLIYTTATLIGLFTIKTNTTRSHLMGAILLPTMLYYLPI
jgi:putative membrane protein